MLDDSKTIEQYLQKYDNQDICRFITCGSVDDGKSTLIGRLLYDSKMFFEDQLSAIKKDSKKFGTTGDKIDLALLVDGLASEREQGITIDVAYRYFSTAKRKYIIADTPGHEQYTRNMATGASTADIAIILIDARKGVLTQTKRHSYIATLLGIKNIIVAINKMDLVDFSQERYQKIVRQYEKEVLEHLNVHESNIKTDYIPISALEGDNIVSSSKNCSWYKGRPLMELLDTMVLTTKSTQKDAEFRFPVQYVNRPHLNFRGFCGTIASGTISVGDEVSVLPSQKHSRVKSIISNEIKDLRVKTEDEGLEITEKAFAPMSTTIVLEDEIDISRGDIIVKRNAEVEISNKFSAMLVWMSETPLSLHKNYLIKRATSVINGNFSSIEYKKDVNTFEKLTADKLELNEIAKCTISFDREIAADSYTQNKYMGSFIVIDKHTNETLGAGMIDSCIKKQDRISKRQYTEEELALNQYVRKNYPEWGCLKL